MKRVRFDFETYSDVDIKKAGAWAYAQCPNARVLMMGWAIDDEPLQMWTPGYPVPDWCSHPQDFVLVAHNAEFEYAVWKHMFSRLHGVPQIVPENMSCTAARSAAAGLPRSLADSAKALKVSVQKHPQGYRYIRLFCCPTVTKSGAIARSASPQIFPAEWAEFQKYCAQDVGAMREIDKVLPELTPMEQRVFWTHMRINERGVRIDRRSIDRLSQLCDRAQQFYRATEYGEALGSPIKLISILSMLGVEVKDCKEDTLEAVAGDPNTPFAARELINDRLDFAKTAIKKLKRMQLADAGDHRLRGMHIFHGAHTGRYTGSLVQLQNLVRETVKFPTAAVIELHKMPDDDDDAIACYGGPGPMLKQASKMVRPMICSGYGKELVVYDFSAIEALNTFWLCGANHMLELFRQGHDPYRFMASLIFGGAPEDYDKDSLERFVGKQTVLGCGYGMGWRKFIVHCLVLAKKVVEETLAKTAVNTFRAQVPQVPAGWKSFDETVNLLFRLHSLGAIEMFGGKLLMWITWNGPDAMTLCCRLPSERIMRWHFPLYVQVPSENVGRDDEMVMTYLTHRKMQVKGQQIIQTLINNRCQARGLDPEVYKSRIPAAMEGWTRVTIWGGKFMENVIQAISRDMLCWAQVRCEEEGYPVVLHVHDENVFEVPSKGIAETHEDIGQLMVRNPHWAPDAFIKVEGWHGVRYRK